jgi:hypothetical protein
MAWFRGTDKITIAEPQKVTGLFQVKTAAAVANTCASSFFRLEVQNIAIFTYTKASSLDRCLNEMSGRN